MNNLSFADVLKARQRLKNYIKNTPVILNEKLNQELGAQIFLKMENQQLTNSFKARGAFNAILAYQEKHGKFPEKIVVQSSGNHAQAIAKACKEFGITALIYMIDKASPLKIKAARDLGAEVVLLEKRSEVNESALQKQKEGYFFIHPADGDYVIAGQGTATLEALQEIGEVDAIFAPCGGGGLIGGSYLAAQGLSPNAKVFGCEPLNANDAARSFQQGKIVGFEDTPNTIADGARTLAVSPQSFSCLKNLSGFFEITEEQIIFWQKKISEILEQKIEPTSALAIAGAAQFLKNKKAQKVLVIISGGNI
jgi:threo-3-hydroxy-L-aspartate ammonia-lyase